MQAPNVYFNDIDNVVYQSLLYNSDTEWMTLPGLVDWWLKGYNFKVHGFDNNENNLKPRR